MEGKLWLFCLTTAVLFSAGSCDNSPSLAVLIVYNETYSGIIQKSNAVVYQTNCTGFVRGCVSQHNMTHLCILSVDEKNQTTSEKCNAQFNSTLTLRQNSSSTLITLTKNNTSDKQNVKLFFPRRNATCSQSPNATDRPTLGFAVCGVRSDFNAEYCKDLSPDTFIIDAKQIRCWTCVNPVKEPDIHLTGSHLESSNGLINAASASGTMKNLSSLLNMMGEASTAGISLGDVKGIISKLDKVYPNKINFGFSATNGMSIVEKQNALGENFNRSVTISKESHEAALQKNGTFVGVLVFPKMSQDVKKSIVLNDEVFGIDMGVPIANLTDPINIQYSNIVKNGLEAHCNSWNGEGNLPNWTRDGCLTVEDNSSSITCQCNHLTFFAILMSSPPKNISASDVASLTYISSFGCGLSMFFLAVALFMHCVMRRTKSSQTTKILVNLFVALFVLNMTFLLNQPIADLASYVPCVIIGAAMHFSLLATFTWFLVEAVHLYLQLGRPTSDINHYMRTINVVGWAFPAVVVIVLVVLRKYVLISIDTDDGKKLNMCWINDVNIHYGVNIGYYACVFVATVTIFIVLARQIFMMTKTKGAAGQPNSPTNNTLCILGLCVLLGITWGFAFFCFGPMTVPCYYIFSILNSFQGFFLFIYYYNSNKIIDIDKGSVFTNNSTSSLSITYVDRSVNNKPDYLKSGPSSEK
ncbi:hypothetical protein DPEC_G00315840 [Dallia pectoralis]|uniref:Uncharacterized protein n=1 Tax=Dallia pectoralis TaxID=75939 RepID=A0ACC2FCI2_DALPE|nr:hypothetical protein DPEC_G00315840 [Dallia pectoralis]